MNLVEKAKNIAHLAHVGQFRRDGVTPYISHPAAVVSGLGSYSSPEVIAAAWLHDVIEDTNETESTLRSAGIPESVIVAVSLLSKTDDISYSDYLARIRNNPIATEVKIADMLANLADTPTEKQIVKYTHGLHFLASKISTQTA